MTVARMLILYECMHTHEQVLSALRLEDNGVPIYVQLREQFNERRATRRRRIVAVVLAFFEVWFSETYAHNRSFDGKPIPRIKVQAVYIIPGIFSIILEIIPISDIEWPGPARKDRAEPAGLFPFLSIIPGLYR